MFRFKQFTIHQDQAAMKVCTDSCILGAFANVTAGPLPVDRVLDIGTGTGLLALMTAQRNVTAQIDAVEIDRQAYQQAVNNVSASPFLERVQVYCSRIQTFEAEPYDRILTNPPFYTNHLRSPDAAVNQALHTDELPFTELLAAVRRLLKPTGQWWVLLPAYETAKLTTLAREYGLIPFQQLTVRQRAQNPIFRQITGFSFEKHTVIEQELLIYEPDVRTYTSEFRTLLRDFYLIF